MIKASTLKNLCLIFFLATFTQPLFAQDNAGMYPKNKRFALAGQGFIAYPGRLGASLDSKLMFRGHENKDVYNEFVMTLKAAHAFSINGGVFSAFDKGKDDNISSLSLLGGYRMNFGVPVPYSNAIDAIGGAFIELNAGVSYVHHVRESVLQQLEEEGKTVDISKLRTWAPAVSGVVGYTFSKKMDVIISYTGAWPVKSEGKVKQSFIGAGLQYNF